MKNILFTLAFISILSACSSAPRLKEYSGEDKGYLAASFVASTGTNYGTYLVSYTKVDRSSSDFLWYVQNNMWKSLVSKRDINNNEVNGVIEVHSLPPGDYVVYHHRIMNGGQEVRWDSAEKFSHPFTIKEGEVTYIGEIKASGVTGENAFGMNVNAGATFYVSNKLNRDLPIILQKLDNKNLIVVEAILPVSYLGQK